MTHQQPVSLHIGRHAIQLILRHAMTAYPSPCSGLLGTDAASPERLDALRLYSNVAESVRQAAQEWREAGVRICGVYHNAASTPESLLTAIRHFATADKLVEIAVEQDMDGRIEANAFLLSATGTRTKIALLLD